MTGNLSYFCNLFWSEFIFERCVLQVILHEMGGILFIAIYAAKGKWFFWDFDLQGLERYVFSNRSAHRATSGGEEDNREYRIDKKTVREVLRFYRHSLFGMPSGGNIFRCTTKDIEERRAKGLRSRPLDSGF